MGLPSNVTEDDVKEFLQQTEEKLQLLDEDLVLLEAYQDNPGYLEEAYRLVHTLATSSARLG